MKSIKSFIRPISPEQDYNDIPVDIHGGLTFGEFAKKLDWAEISEGSDDCFIVGFDCAHYGDNIENCPESFVKTEAENLAHQLEAM